jgi:hypothetical protein
MNGLETKLDPDRLAPIDRPAMVNLVRVGVLESSSRRGGGP